MARSQFTHTLQASWASAFAVKPVSSGSKAASASMTREVVACVCAWPHAATQGAASLLHTILKRNLGIELFGSNLVQVRCTMLTAYRRALACASQCVEPKCSEC